MSLLAIVRPDDWNLPLFLHILGAITLVGGLILAATVLSAAWANGDPAAARRGYRALLFAALPGWIVMRVFAQVIADKEGYDGDKVPTWIDIGFITSEPALLFLIAATVLSGMAARREAARGRRLGRIAVVLVGLMIVAYGVTIWAMTTKPV
jgi:uncharacterized membrane protein